MTTVKTTRFTEYKFSPDFISEITEVRKANLRANRGFSNLQSFGLGVVMSRLEQNPLSYRQYGPYWWRLKSLLNESGQNLGQASDPLVRAEYSFDSPEESIIAADEFRTDFLKNFFALNNEFYLDDSGEKYVLFDPDIELGVN